MAKWSWSWNTSSECSFSWDLLRHEETFKLLVPPGLAALAYSTPFSSHPNGTRADLRCRSLFFPVSLALLDLLLSRNRAWDNLCLWVPDLGVILKLPHVGAFIRALFPSTSSHLTQLVLCGWTFDVTSLLMERLPFRLVVAAWGVSHCVKIGSSYRPVRSSTLVLKSGFGWWSHFFLLPIWWFNLTYWLFLIVRVLFVCLFFFLQPG